MRTLMCGLMLAGAAAAGECSYGNRIADLQTNAAVLGMAAAVTGVENGEASAEINPAALEGCLGRSAALDWANWQGVKMQKITAAYRLNPQAAAGVYVNAVNSGGAYGYDDNGGPVPSKYNGSMTAAGFALAQSRPLLEKYGVTSLGLAGRVITADLNNERSVSFLADIGFLARLEANDLSHLGVSIRNAGISPQYISEEIAPLALSIGVSRYFLAGEKLLAAVNAEIRPGGKYVSAAGGEYRFDLGRGAWGALRAGYTTDREKLGSGSGITAGAGILFAYLGVNYAYRPSPALGDLHLIEIRYQFSPKLNFKLSRYSKVIELQMLEKERAGVQSYKAGLERYLSADYLGAAAEFEAYLSGNNSTYRKKARQLCADSYAKLGLELFDKGEIKEAARFWNAGKALDSANASITVYLKERIAAKCDEYFLLGLGAYSSGNIEAAKKLCSDCLDLDRNYKKAVNALKRLR